MRRRNTWLAGWVALWVAGCSANPQPVPLPGISDQALYLSGSATERFFLAGLPGAVVEPEGTDVVVLNLTRGTTTRGPSGDDGSFLIEVTRAPLEKLEVWAEQGDRISPRVAVLASDVSPPIPPTPLVVQTVSASVGGKSTVTGTAGTALVLVGNQSRGISQAGSTDSLGHWSVSVGAAAGDRLLAFEVEQTSRAASTPISVQVPP